VQGRVDEVVNSFVPDPSSVIGSWAVSMLSDTIAVGITTKKIPGATQADEAFLDRASILLAAGFTNEVLRVAAEDEPVFAYRGCISFGEFQMQESFLVGPAVDEAAECMNLAQGAFVWLTSSARRLPGWDSLVEESTSFFFVRNRVPLKGGDEYETWAIAPFRDTETKAAREALVARLEASFAGGSFDVELKRQRTIDFLKCVAAKAKHA
jgi:hypothetical protein